MTSRLVTSPIADEGADLFSILEAEARAVAAAFGVQTPHELAASLIDRMHHRVQGERYYVAKCSQEQRAARQEAMRREFNGVNLREVAERHGYSLRQARRILVDR